MCVLAFMGKVCNCTCMVMVYDGTCLQLPRCAKYCMPRFLWSGKLLLLVLWIFIISFLLPFLLLLKELTNHKHFNPYDMHNNLTHDLALVAAQEEQKDLQIIGKANDVLWSLLSGTGNIIYLSWCTSTYTMCIFLSYFLF